MTTTRLWELSDEIQQLAQAIALIVDDENLTESEQETKLQETFVVVGGNCYQSTRSFK